MIINFINYNKYSYDHILDKYNETKDKRFLLYCYIKYNKYSIVDIIERVDSPHDKTLLYVFNIQRSLDGLKLITTYKKMYEMITIDQISDIDEDFDF